MSAGSSAARVQPGLPRFDTLLFHLPMSQRSLRGMTWLLEQSARSCEHDGDVELGALLRRDAARFRARVVNA